MPRAPDFWTRRGVASLLLAPLGALYSAGTALRQGIGQAWRAPVPVICVGNLVAGGGGKTPVALAIGAYLVARGRNPHFLTRGYGGRTRGPLRVDPETHRAADVGDEPLLLARLAPAWVCRDRAAGARAAIAAGADVLVMDDGFQNGALVKDIGLIVVDGAYGLGNLRSIPAGPLREAPERGLARADALIVVGEDSAGISKWAARQIPVFGARLVPAPDAGAIARQPVVAFAGIAHPEKFYRTLRGLGCTLVETRDFPDHHPYRADEVIALCERAAAAGALCVTTEKDAVRLPAEASAGVRTLPITLEWAEPDTPDRLLARVLADG